MEIVVGYHVLMVHYDYFIDWFILLLCPVNNNNNSLYMLNVLVLLLCFGELNKIFHFVKIQQ